MFVSRNASTTLHAGRSASSQRSCNRTRSISVMLVGLLTIVDSATAASAPERVRPFTKVEGWRVSTLVKDGKPAGCVAASSYVDGTTLIIGRGAKWWLGLDNQSWARHGTRSLNVSIAVDGKPVHQAAALQKQRLVVMEYGEDEQRLTALMAGHTISFTTLMGRSSFSLRGSARATAAVADCVHRAAVQAAGSTGSVGVGSAGAGSGGAGSGGAFGSGISGGAAVAGQRRVANRAQTLELATTYLAKLGTPYTLLEAGANVLKNFPVNWRFPDGGFGGMAIYTGANSDAQRLFDEFVADNARLCKGTSGLQRQAPAVGERKIIRYSAVGTCEEGGKAYLTDFTLLAGLDLVVAIVNIGAVGGEGMQQRQQQNKKWSL